MMTRTGLCSGVDFPIANAVNQITLDASNMRFVVRTSWGFRLDSCFVRTAILFLLWTRFLGVVVYFYFLHSLLQSHFRHACQSVFFVLLSNVVPPEYCLLYLLTPRREQPLAPRMASMKKDKQSAPLFSLCGTKREWSWRTASATSWLKWTTR